MQLQLCHQFSVLPLLYADEQLTGVLFETSKSSQKSEELVLGAITQQDQIAFALLISNKFMLYNMLYNMIYNMLHMPFAENLFHFKLDQTEYSIAPGDYDKIQLFHDNKRQKMLLNEFYFYVFFQGFVLSDRA